MPPKAIYRRPRRYLVCYCGSQVYLLAFTINKCFCGRIWDYYGNCVG